MHRQELLTPEELERLRRRQRQITAFHAAAMGVLVLAAVAAYRYGDLAWFRGLFVAVIAVLVLAAGILQLRERCPRCGTRLRNKLLVLPPDQCGSCGVAFTRPLGADNS